MLTGDSLFVGDIARPDLAVEPREGAHGIFHSLHDRLLTLPDTCEVWPGHLGGSMCGGPGIDLKVSSTIGYERAHQEVLGVVDEDEFVERAVAGLGPAAAELPRHRGHQPGPLAGRLTQVEPLTPRQVEQHQRDGALVVDVRTELQFDDAHIPGAVCITALRAGFGSRLAWLADHDQPVVVVGRDDDDARGAIALAASVGVTNVAGYLAGGMTSWREERRAVARIERMTSPSCTSAGRTARRCRSSTCASAASGIAGTSRARSTCPTTTSTRCRTARRGRPIAVICASGQRAAVAASLLARHGARDVLHVVDGGVGTWAAPGLAGGGGRGIARSRGRRARKHRRPRASEANITRRELMTDYLAAAKRGDWDTAFGFLAYDLLIHIPGRSAFAGQRFGKQAAVDYVTSIRERYRDGAIELELIDMLCSDERVVLLLRERFHGDGEPIEIRRANVYRVEDEKVVEVSIFEADQYVVDELLH